MKLQQDLLSTGSQTIIFIPTQPIIVGLMNIIIKSPPKIITLLVIYSFKKNPESLLYNSELLNLIPCELYFTPTPFHDTTILTYEIELSPFGEKIGFNSLDDEYFTIPYIIDTIPNSPDDHQLTTQHKRNVWIIYIYREDTITQQGKLNEIQFHQTQCEKSNVNISLYKKNNYHRTYIEDIWSVLDKFRPEVSHI